MAKVRALCLSRFRHGNRPPTPLGIAFADTFGARPGELELVGQKCRWRALWVAPDRHGAQRTCASRVQGQSKAVFCVIVLLRHVSPACPSLLPKAPIYGSR